MSSLVSSNSAGQVIDLGEFRQHQRCPRLAAFNASGQANGRGDKALGKSRRLHASWQFHHLILEQALAEALFCSDIQVLSSLGANSESDFGLGHEYIAQLVTQLQPGASCAVFKAELQALGFSFSADVLLFKRGAMALEISLMLVPLSNSVKPKHQQQLIELLSLVEHSALMQKLAQSSGFESQEIELKGEIVALKAGAQLGDAEALIRQSVVCNPASKAHQQEFLQQLQAFETVYRQYQQCSQGVETTIPALALSAEPKGELSKYCWQQCRYQVRCFGNLPEYHVLQAPLIRPEHKLALLQQHGLDLQRYPEAYSLLAQQELGLTSVQRSYFHAVKEQLIAIDWPAIKSDLQRLQYPLAYLDFEADNPPLNSWGKKPFSKIVFQYSVHLAQNVQQAQSPESVVHRQYLHGDTSDPRYTLAKQLVQDLAGVSSIVVWHAEFERKRLLELASLSDEFESLKALANNLIDLEVVMRKHYRDYRFKGSYSLKQVSQVLLQHAYQGCEVQDGRQVVDVWLRYIHSQEPHRRLHYQQQLLAYCQQDTYTLVELLALLLQGIELTKPSAQP